MTMHRIDRSHRADETSQVVIRTGAGLRRGRVVGVRTAQAQVQTALEPFHWIDVVVHAGIITLEVGLDHVALVVQVADRGVGVALLGLGVVAHAILLAVAGLIGLIVPIQILTPFQGISTGIQLTIHTHDLVVSHTGERIILQLLINISGC